MKRHLLIIADDFGYGKSRNIGIVECFQKHAISATSILANCKFTQHAVDLAKKYNIPSGLHFNITEGFPLSDPLSISSLVTPEGRFKGKNGFWISSSVNPWHVQCELNAQITWFVEIFGKTPLHVDGHQHVHIHCNVRTVFAETLHKYGIQRTRFPCEHIAAKLNCVSSIPLPRQKFHDHVNKLSKKSSDIFSDYSLKKTEGFIGLSLMGSAMTASSLQSALSNFFQLGFTSCELMSHPGHRCDKYRDGFIGDEYADEFSCSADRENEMKVLTSKEMLQFYKDENISLGLL